MRSASLVRGTRPRPCMNLRGGSWSISTRSTVASSLTATNPARRAAAMGAAVPQPHPDDRVWTRASSWSRTHPHQTRWLATPAQTRCWSRSRPAPRSVAHQSAPQPRQACSAPPVLTATSTSAASPAPWHASTSNDPEPAPKQWRPLRSPDPMTVHPRGARIPRANEDARRRR